MKGLTWVSLVVLTGVWLLATAGIGTAEGEKVRAQRVYVPVYSHIYSGNQERPFKLAVTLSIRNTDPAAPLIVEAVDYYDSDGKLVRHYLDKSLRLGAMASVRYVVKESDTTGGSGANFIVRWHAETAVNIPVIESVMIGTQSQQGISFTSRGQAISD